MKFDIENPKELMQEMCYLNGILRGAKIETPDFINLTKLLDDINERFVISEVSE